MDNLQKKLNNIMEQAKQLEAAILHSFLCIEKNGIAEIEEEHLDIMYKHVQNILCNCRQEKDTN
ncbi:hypothetical protein [Bacillus sp. SM2101]|uniref:hypothetical protein n=1 Tax=Bacillus sp. SM2101 TaxID=2805366 RepID=UPI001BDE5305|nr:hypothetical protein [Bacillus sp. SM2101]